MLIIWMTDRKTCHARYLPVPAVAPAVVAVTGVTVTTIITASVVGIAAIVSWTNTNNDRWAIIGRINHRRRSPVNDTGRDSIRGRRGWIIDRGRGSVNWRSHIDRSR
jgi:hypothetical protein